MVDVDNYERYDNSDDDDDEKLLSEEIKDVLSVLYDDNERYQSTFEFIRNREIGTNRKQIKPRRRSIRPSCFQSPVVFLRNRELGILGTNELSTRQRVEVSIDRISEWPLHVKEKIYKRIIERCYEEEKEIYEKEDVKLYWARKIISYLPCESIYIKFASGCKKFVELILYDIFLINCQPPTKYMYNQYYKCYECVSSKKEKDERCYHEEIQFLNKKIPFFFRSIYLSDIFNVQNCKRTCPNDECIQLECIACDCTSYTITTFW